MISNPNSMIRSGMLIYCKLSPITISLETYYGDHGVISIWEKWSEAYLYCISLMNNAISFPNQVL